MISSAENIGADSSVIDALITTSGGDLRRAITYLQSASRLASSTNPPTLITANDIQEIAGVVPNSVVSSFANTIGIETETDMDTDDKDQRKGFEPIKKKVKDLTMEGYSASQILSQVSAIVSIGLATF